jgi:hypothetical protein
MFLDFLLCILIADILDARNTTHNSLNDIFIRPYHGYLREVSRVLSPLAAQSRSFKIIYQNGFVCLQNQHILVNYLLITCLIRYFLWDLQKLSGDC